MRTAEERLELLQRRAALLQRERDKRSLTGWGLSSVGLMAALVVLITALDPVAHGLTGSGSTGAALLSDSTGGYVLVGVIAFMVGVALTAWLIRRRKKPHPRQKEEEENRPAV